MTSIADRLTRIQHRLYRMRRIADRNSTADATTSYPLETDSEQLNGNVGKADVGSAEMQGGTIATVRSDKMIPATHPGEAMQTGKHVDAETLQQGGTDAPSAWNRWAENSHEAQKQAGTIAELHRGEEMLTAAEATAHRQGREYAAPAIDYDLLAEALSRRPIAVYVDKKATAAVLTREMDTQIGNRNIQQLMSMGG